MYGHSRKVKPQKVCLLDGHRAGRDTWKDISDSTGIKAEPVGLDCIQYLPCFSSECDPQQCMHQV